MTMRRQTVFLMTPLVAALASGATAGERLHPQVPRGHGDAIVIDGRIEPREWDDAASLEIGGGIDLLAKQTPNAIYLAVRGPDRVPRPVDLFVRTADARLLHLHASMSIGERDLTAQGAPSDDLPWRWHVHPGWNANRANLDPSQPSALAWSARLLPRDGVELQILRSKLDSAAVEMLIDVRHFPGTDGSTRFPDGADFGSTGWLRLEFGD